MTIRRKKKRKIIWEEIGDVHIDIASLVIADPGDLYIAEYDRNNKLTSFEPDERNIEIICRRVSEVLRSYENHFQIVDVERHPRGMHAVYSTTGDDGAYPVYAKYQIDKKTNHKSILEIKILFDGSMAEEDLIHEQEEEYEVDPFFVKHWLTDLVIKMGLDEAELLVAKVIASQEDADEKKAIDEIWREIRREVLGKH